MNEEIDPIFNDGWNNCVNELEILIGNAFSDPPKDKPTSDYIMEIIKSHKISDQGEEQELGTLPPIIKDEMIMDVNSQISVSLFPRPEGQPEIDVIKLSLKQIEGIVSVLFFTPCEAIEISQALMNAVQFYLYNQEQYREEILEKRFKLSGLRSDRIIPNSTGSNSLLIMEISLSDKGPEAESLIVSICKNYSIPYRISEGKERKIVLGDQE